MIKSFLAPETNGFRALRSLGSIFLGLAILAILASVAMIIGSLAGMVGLRFGLTGSVLWLYSIPLAAIGLFLRWLVVVYGLLTENNQLLKQIAEQKQA